MLAILVNGIRVRYSSPKSIMQRFLKPTPGKTVLSVILIVIVASPTVFVFAPPSWELPPEYDQATKWLSIYSADSSTMVVPFGGVYMRSEDYGVSRNPSYFAPLLSGNPVFTGEGATTEMRQLSNFLGNAILSYQSNRIPQVLGWFGTKYFLFTPPYNDSLFSTGWNQVSSPWNPNLNHKILLNQDGLKKEISIGNLTIFSNSNSKDMFAISDSPVAMVGGQNSLLMVAQIANDSTSAPALIALSPQSPQISSTLLNFSSVMFADADYNDLLMFNVNSEYVFGSQQLLKLAKGSAVLDNAGMAKGFLVLSGSSLRLASGSSLVLGGALQPQRMLPFGSEWVLIRMPARSK